MGFIHKEHGSVAIESRRESFVVHMGYGYSKNGEMHEEHPLQSWREDPHPEFMNEDLDDLIAALEELRSSRKSR